MKRESARTTTCNRAGYVGGLQPRRGLCSLKHTRHKPLVALTIANATVCRCFRAGAILAPSYGNWQAQLPDIHAETAQMRVAIAQLAVQLDSTRQQLAAAPTAPMLPASARPAGVLPLEVRHRKLKAMYQELKQQLKQLEARLLPEQAAPPQAAPAAAPPGPSAAHAIQQQQQQQQQHVWLYKEPLYSQMAELGITGIARCP